MLTLTLLAGPGATTVDAANPDIAGKYVGTTTLTMVVPPGNNPKTSECSASIEDVDYDTNTLKFRGWDYSFKVNPDGSISFTGSPAGVKFEMMIVGDKLTGRMTAINTAGTVTYYEDFDLTKEPSEPEEPAECTVKLSASPANGGTVSGGGTFAVGDEVTVKARAESGYILKGWYRGAKFLTLNENYRFTAEGPEMAFEAIFVKNTQNTRAAFSELYGEVLVGKMGDDGEIEWELAFEDTILATNDYIKCEAESGCTLSFSDMTTFTIKENTQIQMTPPDGAGGSKVVLAIGGFWVTLNKMIKTGSMSVEMNQAVLGTKGTTFACEETGSTSTVKIFEGEVELTSKKTGEVISVSAGEAVVTGASGSMSKSTFNIAQEAAKWGVPAEYLGSAPVQSGALTAIPSKTSFEMNGKPVSVPQAYNINDNNYLQLRGIAVLLNGTKAQFNVGWDGKYAVIETGKAYSGEANYAAMQTTTNVRQSNTSFKIDGKLVTFEKAYLIDGDTNYLQLREVAEQLSGTKSQFNVYWDAAASKAVIVPGVKYTGVK